MSKILNNIIRLLHNCDNNYEIYSIKKEYIGSLLIEKIIDYRCSICDKQYLHKEISDDNN